MSYEDEKFSDQNKIFIKYVFCKKTTSTKIFFLVILKIKYRKEARENSPIFLTNKLSEVTKKFKNMKLFLVHTEFDAVTIKLWHKRFIEVVYIMNH